MERKQRTPLRATDEEWATIKAAAGEAGVPAGRFLREAALAAASDPVAKLRVLARSRPPGQEILSIEYGEDTPEARARVQDRLWSLACARVSSSGMSMAEALAISMIEVGDYLRGHGRIADERFDFGWAVRGDGDRDPAVVRKEG